MKQAIAKRKICNILLIGFLMISILGNAQNNSLFKKKTNLIKINVTKLITNDYAVSFEHKVANNAYDIELSCFFPITYKENNLKPVASQFNSMPILCYSGLSLNVLLKHYTTSENYYGLSVLFRYAEFENTWVTTGDDVQAEYNVNCSQKREVMGLAFRVGYIEQGKRFALEPYAAFGFRLISSKTTYNSYVVNEYGNYIHQGSICSILYDNGLYCLPYINMGIKLSFELQKKK